MVSFGDDVLTQLKAGKTLSEVEVGQSALNGLKQGILNIIVQKTIKFGIGTFSKWKGKYTSQELEDALDAFQKNPEKYLDGGSGKVDLLTALRSNISFASYFDDLTNGIITRKFVNILSIEEEAVLKFYTTDVGYKDFNKALRGEIAMTDFFTAQKNLMEQALDKLPVFTDQSTLWRGLKGFNLNQIKELYKEGAIVTEKGFVSSAYNLDDFIKSSRARDFDVIIKIEGKNGKLIEAISTLPEEAEILFKSNLKFEVKKAGMELHPDPKFENPNGYPLIWTIVLKEL